MINGEQGETVTVQDREIDEADAEKVGSDAEKLGSDAEKLGSDAEKLGSDAEKVVATDTSSTPDETAAGEASPAPTAARSARDSVRDLEEEGEVAADYLEELLDIVDVDGDIDIDVENGRASVAIVSEVESDRSLRRLVGSNGEVLEALQELTRLAVQASTGERSRLMLDIAGHRANRRKVLTEVATKACAQVLRTGKSMSLDPMSAFERKIVHDVVATAGLSSESEGADPHRHVIILPAST
jgi:spoIIIJ-associated protein